jgi:hypothetical protein
VDEYIASIAPGGPRGAAGDDAASDATWPQRLEAAFGARLAELAAPSLPPVVLPAPLPEGADAGIGVQLQLLGRLICALAYSKNGSRTAQSLRASQLESSRSSHVLSARALMSARTGAAPSVWAPQPPANGGVQQPQLQGDVSTPAPVGGKRKFVASPPPEAVSPLFSTPGELRPHFQHTCTSGSARTKHCHFSTGHVVALLRIFLLHAGAYHTPGAGATPPPQNGAADALLSTATPGSQTFFTPPQVEACLLHVA